MRWCQEGQTKHEWLFLHEMGKVRLHLPVPMRVFARKCTRAQMS